MPEPAAPQNNWHYNAHLKARASEMRRHPTPAEKRLWYAVLRNQQTGYKFMRQRPMLSYVADFFCKDLRLVIEVDGSIHRLAEQAAYDRQRQANIEAVGLHVLRFTNEQVLKQTDWVRGQIEEWIARHPPSPPCPLTGGQGGDLI